MRALVTGGAGFIGSHVVDALLARGDEVVVLDHRLRSKALPESSLARVRAYEDDICDSAAVRKAANGCALIFHCAAVVGVAAYSENPTRTMETEEAGLRNVCAAARRVRAKVIYTSSSAVYGLAEGALDESLPVSPASNYGTAKRFGELYLAAQNSEHRLRSASVRIFNVYGPRQDERLVLPRFVRQAKSGQPLEIYGEGLQTRDFVYVADVVAAMLACAESVCEQEIVNACTGVETSVLQLAHLVIKLTGSRSNVVHKPLPEKRSAFEISRSFGNRSKLERLFGAIPLTPLADGLAKTIASFSASAVVPQVARVSD